MTTNDRSTVLKDVVAYVDVWSSDKRANYSKPFVQQLQEMGAEVSQRFNKQVTHVVFNNGHLATWRKAKKSEVQLVSFLWVGRCYDDGVRADEKLFPALNDESNPVMKNRKHRCMLPKDSPEKTTENDWRMRKKLDKMMKDLAPKEPLVTEMSPIIIDEENGIIYSPALKRSDYMARRLKDMKDKRENLSPTASQMAESCSPTGLKPSLGSTPTVFKFKLDDQSDDDSCASVAELGCSPDKEEGRSHSNGRELGCFKHSGKPGFSPCHDVPKRISSEPDCPDFKYKEDEEGNKQTKPRISSARKKAAEKFKCEYFLESPLQDWSDKKAHTEQKQSQTKSPNVFKKGEQNVSDTKSFTDTGSYINPAFVKSLGCLSLAMPADTASARSKAASTPSQKMERRTPKRSRSSLSALVRSATLSSECKSGLSDSTEGEVFEDYFSPANRKKAILPNLPMESTIQIPFELDSPPKKRKQRSKSFGFEPNGKKTQKPEKSQSSKKVQRQSNEVSEPQSVQQDKKTSLTELDNPRDNLTLSKRRRQSTLALSSTSTAKIDEGKWRSAFKPDSPSLPTENATETEQQKHSDFAVLSHTVESGGNECTVAAGFTEVSSETEENRKKQLCLSLQTMVNKTKNMRTLVMTSMPTEKQHTVVQVVKALGGFSIVDRVCESTTHVVSGGHRRTLNILLGIARGCWILSFEWILWCLEQRQWIPEEPYELSDQFPAAQICRLQRHLSAGEHQQDLFQGQPAMFVSQHSQPPSQSLVELVELCGGTVCKTVRQAGICIGKYSGRRPKGSRILSEQWILDSITNLKVLSYDNYDLEFISLLFQSAAV